MKYTLNLVTLTKDHGDGSSSTYLYNTMDELLTDQNASYNYGYPSVMSEEQKEELRYRFQDDPYQYGSLGTDSIELELVDGKIILACPTSIYGNQQ